MKGYNHRFNIWYYILAKILLTQLNTSQDCPFLSWHSTSIPIVLKPTIFWKCIDTTCESAKLQQCVGWRNCSEQWWWTMMANNDGEEKTKEKFIFVWDSTPVYKVVYIGHHVTHSCVIIIQNFLKIFVIWYSSLGKTIYCQTDEQTNCS